MTSVSRKSKGHDLVEKYRTHLESRIGKGDRSFVCRDEKLCKEVEVLLTKGNAEKILNLRGLESLTVIENSLQAFSFKTGHLGLEKVSKAFEVLELAALNLYLYPWRKEYKFVKMFSGMFTHCIKPALTLQQAKELFGLLGYQPVSHYEEQELALDSKLLTADFILGLACAFFTARIECQLLLSTLGSVDTSVESVLQLVKERQKGHSLHLALENTKKKIEAAHSSHAKLTGAIDSELDLYTDKHLPQADASHMTSSSSAPPRSSYIQPKETFFNNSLYGHPSYRLNNENTSQEEALCVSMHQCQISNPKTHVSLSQNPGLMESIGKDQIAGDGKEQTAEVGEVICTCITSSLLFLYYCKQCNHIHSPDCIYYNICTGKGHTLSLCDIEQQQNTNIPHFIPDDQPKRGKDFLKNHQCMCNSTADKFLVCHSCQIIHDWSCENVKVCEALHHNLQFTGVIQPPQEVNAPKRHFCLTSESPEYVICHTCNIAHDCRCTDYAQNCIAQQHDVLYHQELREMHNTPIKYHQCCIAKQPLPEIACLTCKAFHSSTCSDSWECSYKHKIHRLGTKCVTCLSREIHTLCRYCFLLYCKACWYKDPMTCKCGNLFDSLNCSPV
ncbi:spermatogenesis associated 2-like [Triplophysa rosa]|nr:spermatogenesis associated 2-like [Triplophysa rosa]